MADDIPKAWIERWQGTDGSWHIILTPHVLTVVPRAVFKRFMAALYDMEQALVDAGKKEDDDERR